MKPTPKITYEIRWRFKGMSKWVHWSTYSNVEDAREEGLTTKCLKLEYKIFKITEEEIE